MMDATKQRLRDVRTIPIGLGLLGGGAIAGVLAGATLLPAVVLTGVVFVFGMTAVAVTLPEWRDDPEKKTRTAVIMTIEIVVVVGHVLLIHGSIA